MEAPTSLPRDPREGPSEIELQPIGTLEAQNGEEDSNIERVVSTSNASTGQKRRRQILIVVSSTLLAFTCCGLNFAFGVYQELYETLGGPFDNASPAEIDLIGTLAVSLMTLGAPIASAWTKSYSPRIVTLWGGLLFGLANIIASFGQQLWHFILTQGLMMGCGTCLCYIPAVTITPGWFDDRRGLAMGIVLSGTGLGGVAWAPLLRYLNSAIGFRNTLRLTGAISIVLVGVAALALKWEPSTNVQHQQVRRQRQLSIPLASWTIVRSRPFTAQAAAGFFQAAAYYTPVYFFSSYARTLGYSSTAGANFIAMSNASSAGGKIVLGYLADRFGRLNILVLCTLLSALSTFSLWLPSSVLGALNIQRGLFIAYACIYGITGGAYISLFPITVAEQFGIQNFASINGLLYMLRGFGTLIGTPVAGSLIHSHSGAIVETVLSYEKTIFMVGALLLVTTIAVSWARLEAGPRTDWKWRA